MTGAAMTDHRAEVAELARDLVAIDSRRECVSIDELAAAVPVFMRIAQKLA